VSTTAPATALALAVEEDWELADADDWELAEEED
jgi:hypothetical protein